MPTKPIRPVAIGSPSHEVRIIGGQWKRSKIKVIDRPGLRPTPDRVRETLFNWLGQDLTDWRCVDAFAGTGALGFEAASRGAQSVLMLEQDAQLVTLLSQTRERLKAHTVQVQKGDAMMALQRLAPNSLDVVFLDPPFEGSHFENALKAAAKAVVPGGWVYLEAPLHWTDEALQVCGLQAQKHMKAGAVHAHLLQRPIEG
ncbi:MAG: Ribosomal small subunit methyltransferase [Pseudomonadota bacterium]|jgi:16S rRNA (guanine(966)-N(2))-methyltransferase RsmD